MKPFPSLLLGLFLLLSACGSSGDKAAANEARGVPEVAPAVDEDALIMRLSPDLVADPQTQAAVDRNAIANYAIDKLLDVRSTPSGLYYQILQEGEGALIQWGDRLRVHYRGFFLDGREFDSSYGRDKPLEFYVGNMIAGWNEGLQLLRPGGKALLLIPSELGYGAEGLQDSKGKYLVPPDQVLAFEIEVLEKIIDN